MITGLQANALCLESLALSALSKTGTHGLVGLPEKPNQLIALPGRLEKGAIESPAYLFPMDNRGFDEFFRQKNRLGEVLSWATQLHGTIDKFLSLRTASKMMSDTEIFLNEGHIETAFYKALLSTVIFLNLKRTHTSVSRAAYAMEIAASALESKGYVFASPMASEASTNLYLEALSMSSKKDSDDAIRSGKKTAGLWLKAARSLKSTKADLYGLLLTRGLYYSFIVNDNMLSEKLLSLLALHNRHTGGFIHAATNHLSAIYCLAMSPSDASQYKKRLLFNAQWADNLIAPLKDIPDELRLIATRILETARDVAVS